MAEAREKNAFLRVGGGELFDQAYCAVFFDWNRNPSNLRKYHFVGGGAGTVGSAGGWMASGGLSGIGTNEAIKEVELIEFKATQLPKKQKTSFRIMRHNMIYRERQSNGEQFRW